MAGKKILVVEDEVSLLQPLLNSFKARDFEVFGASNSEEGLAAALKNIPDMILLDLTMQQMDGIEMLKRLSSDPAYRQMKVMVLTNLSDSTKASETAGLGVLDYIVKSDWKLNDIVTRVTDKIGN